VCGGHSAPNSGHISIFTDGISCFIYSYEGNGGDYVRGVFLGAADLLADLLIVARVVDIVGGVRVYFVV
jgi:hypothetical protein